MFPPDSFSLCTASSILIAERTSLGTASFGSRLEGRLLAKCAMWVTPRTAAAIEAIEEVEFRSVISTTE
jgi:hypothetical protein